MKKKVLFIIPLVLLFIVLSVTAQESPTAVSVGRKQAESGSLQKLRVAGNGTQQSTGVKKAFAIMTLGVGENVSLNNKVVQFTLQDTPTFTEAVPFYETSSAGAYADGSYYIASTRMDGANEVPDKLVRADLENKKTNVVGSLSGLDNFVNDMTYDYSTSTMFAIARDRSNSKSILYSINLTSGAAQTVATLDQKYITLACTYDGSLYTISFSGDFYRLDKKSGKTTRIGPTGYTPTYFQSMEFDHSTGILYWTPNIIQTDGSVVVETNMLATIDLKTGKATRIGLLADDIQLAGLYIPFVAAPSEAPAAVSDFTAVPSADGAYQATLSWTNPVRTFGGKDLTSLQKIEVLRDDQVIKTFDAPVPGAKLSYTDVLADHTQGKFHKYTVIAYNEVNAGAPAEVSVFIGLDIPQSPRALTYLKNSSQSITLSWDPSEIGANGGQIDHSSLTYRVVRNPGEVVLAEDLQTTMLSDENIVEINGYTYSVYAVNAQGQSEPAVTPEVVLGPALTLPYDCDFSTDEQRHVWSVIDADADGNSWKMEYAASLGASCATYRSPAGASANDWLSSHVMNIKQGESYKVSFDVFSLGPNDFKFELLKDNNTAQPVQKVGEFSQIKCYMLTSKSFVFTADLSGEFNMGIHVVSQPNTSWLYITNFHMERIADNNLTAVSLRGTDSPVLGSTYQYMILVANKGRVAQSAYSVYLKDGSGRTLGSTSVTEKLDADQSVEVPVQWTVTDEQTTEIYGEAVLPGDQIETDNTTERTPISVQPKGSADKVSLGMNTETTTTSFPFTLGSTRSANQNLYTSSEIGFEGGWINMISYQYMSNATKDVVKAPVKIYMTNTDRTDNKKGWIPENEYTLVYEDTVTFEKGQHQLDIKLDKAFFYNGRNLAVLTAHTFSGYDYAMGISFLYYPSPLPLNNAIGYDGNSPFDFSQYPSRRQGNSSAVMYMMVGSTSVSGKIADSDKTPLPGAKVSLIELGIEVTADETGSYHIGYIPEGTYTLECSKDGYPTQRLENVQVGADGLKQDFSMQELQTYSVSGRVTAPNGTAVAGAEVQLYGYDALKTIADAQGTFSFKNVIVAEENIVQIAKEWYKTYSTKFRLTDQNVDLGEIKLEYYIYPAVNAQVTASETEMTVKWDEAFAEARIQKDHGTVDGQYGLSSDNGMGLIGTLFKDPLILKEISWYTTIEGGPHNTVNLYIFALDETGKPTDQLLYSERSIRNLDDEWNVHTLKTPVVAPYGCAVTLNYPGFIGIALDKPSYEFPFVENTFIYAMDYTNPEFDYLDKLGLRQNLLIRVAGKALPENLQDRTEDFTTPEESSGMLRYKVWRMTEEAVSEKDWTELTTEPINTTTFTDKDWASLPPAVYRYAIRSIYPDGSAAKPVFTSYIAHNMDLQVTVRVKTNSKTESASGATVTLTDHKGNHYEATIETANEAVFTNLWKGCYQVAVTLPGFEPVKDKLEWTTQDTYVTAPYLLKEITEAPFNLNASVDGTTARLYWNEAGDIFDDFEEHTDFTIASAGKAGWSYLDHDGANTYASQAFDFPHRQEPMSYIVFNPFTTIPAVNDQQGMQPYSGKKFLACFNAVMGNDDYIISPQLNYHEGGTLSFWAKSYVAAYQDSFRFGYSLSGKRPEDFVWLNTENPTADSWNMFMYELPAGTQYIAINCNSGNDGFIFMLDDITITSGKDQEMHIGNHAPEVYYEISVDGEVVGKTENTDFTLNGLSDGSHTVSIRAVYHSGLSKETTITLNVVSAITEAETAPYTVSPNPATDKAYINKAFDSATLYDMAGRKVDVISGEQQYFDVSGLTTGVYVIRLTGTDQKVYTLKLQIR